MEKSVKRRFIFWQQLTIWLLLVGYVGYYFCRTNYAVIKPVLLAEFSVIGLDLKALGIVSSAGIGAYVLGKLILGPISDYVGGRLIFVLGMCGSVLSCIYFGTALTLTSFVIAWMLNRFFQAAGWGALVQLVTQWYSYKHYGKVMGFLSLSYLFGDSVVRLSLGHLLNTGYGWRGVMLVSSAILGVIAFVMWMFLRSSPVVLNLPETRNHPANLFANSSERVHFGKLILTYLKSRSFFLIMFMSLGLTILRETFNEWSNTYLVEEGNLSPGIASQVSAVFPFAGGLAGLAYGYFSDFTQRFRGILVGGSQVLLAGLFIGVGSGRFDYHFDYAPYFMALTAVLLVGPYTYMSGVLIMELAGKKGTSSAAALVDSIGYIGSIFAGYGVAHIAQQYDWRMVFLLLGAIALLTSLAGFLFWVGRERKYLFDKILK